MCLASAEPPAIGLQRNIERTQDTRTQVLQQYSAELDFNVLLTARGYMTSGHTADMTAEHMSDMTPE